MLWKVLDGKSILRRRSWFFGGILKFFKCKFFRIIESLAIKCDSILYDKLGDNSLSEKQLFYFFRIKLGHDAFNGEQGDKYTE